MYQPTVIDHPEIPGAAIVTAPDGSRLTVDKSRLPGLGLAQAGAVSMNSPQSTQGFGGPMRPDAGYEPITAEQLASAQVVSGQRPAVSAPNARPTVTASQADLAGQYLPKPAEPQQPQQEQKQASSQDSESEQKYVPTNRDRLLQELDSPYKRVGGSAGFDPRAYDASLAPVRRAQTTQVSGARDFDPAAVEQYQEKEREAAQLKSQADVIQANNEYQTQKAMADEVGKLTAIQEADQRAAEDNYNSKMQGLQDEAKKVAAREVDPKRVFKDMNTWQKVGFVLASALSGYANKGQRNPIMEQMDAQIAQDIRSQELQIQNSKGVTDNALARLSQEWGSIQAGKSALRVQQYEAAKQRVQLQAAAVGTAQAQVRAEAMTKALEAQQFKEFENLRVASMGETSTATQAALMAPKKAAAGGLVMKSLSERVKDAEAAQKIVGSDIEQRGKNLQNYEKIQTLQGGVPSEVEAKNLPQAREHLGKGLAEVAGLRTNVDQIMSRGGITMDKNGNAVHKGIPGIGYGYNFIESLVGKNATDALASVTGGTDAAVIRSQAQEALTNKIKEASGAAFSEQEAERHAKALGLALSQGEDAFAQAIVNFRKALDEKESSLRAGAGVAASRSYDAAKRQLEEDRDYGRTGIRGAYTGTVPK